MKIIDTNYEKNSIYQDNMKILNCLKFLQHEFNIEYNKAILNNDGKKAASCILKQAELIECQNVVERAIDAFLLLDENDDTSKFERALFNVKNSEELKDLWEFCGIHWCK